MFWVVCLCCDGYALSETIEKNGFLPMLCSDCFGPLVSTYDNPYTSGVCTTCKKADQESSDPNLESVSDLIGSERGLSHEDTTVLAICRSIALRTRGPFDERLNGVLSAGTVDQIMQELSCGKSSE
jgi:hypothetical protein